MQLLWERLLLHCMLLGLPLNLWIWSASLRALEPHTWPTDGLWREAGDELPTGACDTPSQAIQTFGTSELQLCPGSCSLQDVAEEVFLGAEASAWVAGRDMACLLARVRRTEIP